MITKCEICNNNFNKPSRHGMSKYIPNICSDLCFYFFIKFNKTFVIDKKDERILDFKDRSNTYRSSYEEKLGRFLNVKDIDFKYEPFSFVLSNKTRYVPDFIIDNRIIVEVKGTWYAQGKKKIKLFSKEFNYPIYLADYQFLKLLKNKGRTKWYPKKD